MRGISNWFLASGALFALIGMGWGIQMSATHDHMLSPAHAHLNLIGFVAMSIFGFYYALTPSAATTGLAKIHLVVTLIAVILIIPGIVMAVTGTGEALAIIGSFLAVLSMAIFAYTILRNGVGRAVA